MTHMMLTIWDGPMVPNIAFSESLRAKASELLYSLLVGAMAGFQIVYLLLRSS